MQWGLQAPPGTHLSREQVEELRGEGHQTARERVIEAAGSVASPGGSRGGRAQPGGEQHEADLEHRSHQVQEQQETQQGEVRLGARTVLA